jgi:hypothetical protein
MSPKGKLLLIKFGEFGEASVRKLRDSMPDAQNFSSESRIYEEQVQITVAINKQIAVWTPRFAAD